MFTSLGHVITMQKQQSICQGNPTEGKKLQLEKYAFSPSSAASPCLCPKTSNPAGHCAFHPACAAHGDARIQVSGTTGGNRGGRVGDVTQCPIYISAGMFLGEFTLLEPHRFLQYALSCLSGLHSLKPGVSDSPSL